MNDSNRSSHTYFCFTRTTGPVARFVATLLLVALSAPSARGVLIAHDSFLTSGAPTGGEYALGNIAGQNPTISGFSGAWFTSNGASPTLQGASLNYTDPAYPSEEGGSVLSPTSNSRVHRLLGESNPFEPSDVGTVYMSLLLQTGTNNGYRAFEMHNGGNEDGSHRTLQIGLSSFTDFPSTSQFGFRVNNSGAFDYALGPENGGVRLFLVKFDLTTVNNGDSITVWNNPDISSLAGDPAGGVTGSGFNFAADRLGIGHFGGTAVGLDELRIGDTLADVLTTSLTCDVNGNGVCNSSDLEIISDHLFLPGVFADGDLDSNGVVDHRDFRLFKNHPARVVGYDPGGGLSVTVPEPAAGLVLGLVMLGCLVVLRECDTWCVVLVAVLSIHCVAMGTAHAAEEDLLNDDIHLFSGAKLETRTFTALPGGFNNIIQMTHKPSDTRMFVTTEQGSVFVVNESGGVATPQLWFDAAGALQTTTGRSMNFSGSQQGLQSIAFHPNFERAGQPGYGKFYTTMLEDRPSNPESPDHFYLGNSVRTWSPADGVLAEWTYDHSAGAVDTGSYRELFRVDMPNYDHPIKLAQFNPHADEGDEDYGLLYVTHGDSNNQDSLNDDPQDRGDVLGKMLRINPLQSGADRYTVPSSNPYYSGDSPSTSGTALLGEVYAYGFRNPHTFSFNRDSTGDTHILVGDIGRSNMEEINLVVPGGNYGWTKREGTFVHLQGSTNGVDAGYFTGVDPLAANEATVGVGPDGENYIYPVAQYDHNDTNTGVGFDFTATAVAGGFVIRNGTDPALQNQYIFHNFSFQNGNVYHVDLDEALGAVTQLDAGDPTRDEPDELTQALKYRLRIEFDHDNNPATAPLEYDTLETMISGDPFNQSDRSNARFGEGLSGEMYISSKQNGAIYLVTNTLPEDRLTLNVDQSTGLATVTNSTGATVGVESLSVFSPSESLDPAELQGVAAGWAASPYNSERDTTQSTGGAGFNLTGANSADLGDIFAPVLAEFGQPAGQDLQFVYETSGSDGRRFVGDVVYTGTPSVQHTFTLTVDVGSGRAVMLNPTPFSQEVDLYTISSDGGSLDEAEWDSLEAQGVEAGAWVASPGLSTRLSEVQEEGTTTFDDATPFDLGAIFTPGSTQDLRLEFLLGDENDLREGIVVYMLAGDYNNDGMVDAADYTVWRDHEGEAAGTLANDIDGGVIGAAQYLTWVENFGKSLPTPPPATVPEPAAGAICLLLAAARACRKRADLA